MALVSPLEVVEGPPNAPIASRTVLGWTVHDGSGCRGHGGRIDDEFTCHIWHYNGMDDMLHRMVANSFTTEGFGVSVQGDSLSRADLQAQAIMDQTTHRIGSRWETGLLWKKKDCVLPGSKEAALQ